MIDLIKKFSLTTDQLNNLEKILYNDFFYEKLKHVSQTDELIKLIMDIKEQTIVTTNNTILDFNHDYAIQTRAKELSLEENKLYHNANDKLSNENDILKTQIEYINVDLEKTSNLCESKDRKIISLTNELTNKDTIMKEKIDTINNSHQKNIYTLQNSNNKLQEKYNKSTEEKFNYSQQQTNVIKHEFDDKLSLQKKEYDDKLSLQKKDFENKLTSKDNIIFNKDKKIDNIQEKNLELSEKCSILNNHSQKKGEIGEHITQEYYVPNGWTSKLVKQNSHSGDHIFNNPHSNYNICVDSKLYKHNVPSKEVRKLIDDVANTNSQAGIIISHTSGISWESKPLNTIHFKIISNKPYLFISNANNLDPIIIKGIIIAIDEICNSLKGNDSSENIINIQNKIHLTTLNLNKQIEHINDFKNNINELKTFFLKSYTKLINSTDRILKDIHTIIHDLTNDLTINHDIQLLYDISQKSPDSGFSTKEQEMLLQYCRINISKENIQKVDSPQENSQKVDSPQENSQKVDSQKVNSLKENKTNELFKNPKNYNDINDFKIDSRIIFKFRNKIVYGKVSKIKNIYIDIISDNYDSYTKHILKDELRIILPN